VDLNLHAFYFRNENFKGTRGPFSCSEDQFEEKMWNLPLSLAIFLVVVADQLPRSASSEVSVASAPRQLRKDSSVRYEPTWESLDTRPNPPWFDDAKFGIFLHWGVFSVPALVSEWYDQSRRSASGSAQLIDDFLLIVLFFCKRFWSAWKNGNKEAEDFMQKNYPPDFTYQDFAKDFHASFFDPQAWTKIFENSGAK
jgi:hypothetical protein